MNTCSFAGNLCWLMYNWSSEQASAPKPPLIPINYSWSPLPCVCSGAKPSQAPKAKGFSITRITRTVGAQVVPGFCSLCEEKTSQLCSYVIVWMFDLHKVERPIRSLLSLASLNLVEPQHTLPDPCNPTKKRKKEFVCCSWHVSEAPR